MEYLPGILLLVAFVIFIPVSAVCYYNSRHLQRHSEIERYLKILKIKKAELFEQQHEFSSLMTAVFFVTLLSTCFWALMLFGDESGVTKSPSYLFGAAAVYEVVALDDGAADTGAGANANKRMTELRQYQSGALLTFNMAFLGAYLWGIQNIARRYTMNDLIPSAYYNIGIRMIFASTLALVFYHLTKMTPEFMASLFLDESATQSSNSGDTTHLLMPIIAFLIGFFPQRGLKWLTEKFSMFTQVKDPSVRDLPLEMIEGITIYDRVRLQELGVDTCYDLANIDYIPYLFKSPYSPRELINWILQAKLCVYFGAHVKALREHGIHTVWQLKDYDEEALKELVRVSALTEDTLLRVKQEIEKDSEIVRLTEAQLELSRYWEKPPEQS